MASKDTEEPVTTHNDLGGDSADERDANETTPLMGSTNDFDHRSNTSNERQDGSKRWSMNERILYGSLFSIPVLLFVPSLVFFIMTLNLRATLPPSSSLEIISNLTHKVKDLSHSLSKCESNSTSLALQLHDEQQRVDMCRESEKRLAERVAVVEDMLDVCQHDEQYLKEQLQITQQELGMCVSEKEELKRQMESGVFVQFLDMVGKLGTGGDSWVCTDTTPVWSYGYASDQSPHPTIPIQTWTAELTDAQHSTAPLVFPPPPPSAAGDANPHPPSPSRPSRYYDFSTSRVFKSQARLSASAQAPSPESNSQPWIYDLSPRIIGFTVSSLNVSGNNGWWRITKLPAFGVKDATVEFFAQAAKWYGSKAQFQVTVYWIEDKELVGRGR